MTEVIRNELVVDVTESPPLTVTSEQTVSTVAVTESPALTVLVEKPSGPVELTILPDPAVVTVEQSIAPVDVSILPDPATVVVEVPGHDNDAHLVHVQATPALEWTVAHNLGKFPSVTIVDSAGSEVEAAVRHNDANNLTVTFTAAMSGSLYLN